MIMYQPYNSPILFDNIDFVPPMVTFSHGKRKDIRDHLLTQFVFPVVEIRDREYFLFKQMDAMEKPNPEFKIDSILLCVSYYEFYKC